jgi:hypothetical protein
MKSGSIRSSLNQRFSPTIEGSGGPPATQPRSLVSKYESIADTFWPAIASTPTLNSFTVTCNNTGTFSGSDASYSLGFTFAHNAGAGSISSGTITSPANANVVLASFRTYLAASTRSGTTYNLTVPASSINGGGEDTGEDNLIVPVLSVRQHGAGNILMTIVGATLTKDVGNYNTFQVASLGLASVPINIQMIF